MLRNLIANMLILRNRLVYAMRLYCRDILPPVSFQHAAGAMPYTRTDRPGGTSAFDEV